MPACSGAGNPRLVYRRVCFSRPIVATIKYYHIAIVSVNIVVNTHNPVWNAYWTDTVKHYERFSRLAGAYTVNSTDTPKYDFLIHSMHIGMVVQNPAGEITAANPAAGKILGLSQDEVMGRTSFDPRWYAIREDGSPFPGEQHPAQVALKTGERVTGVIMGVYSPAVGRLKWIRVDSYPQIRDGAAQPYQVFTIFEDITDTVSAREHLAMTVEDLRASHERFSSLLKSMDEGVALHEMISDAKGNPVNYRILSVNPKYEEILGIPASDVIGKTATDAYRTPDPPFIDTYSQVVHTKKMRQITVFFEPMGKHFRIIAIPWSFMSFATIFVDITDVVLAETRSRHESRINESFAQLYEPLVTGSDTKAITDLILRQALHITDSRDGKVMAFDPEVGEILSSTLDEMDHPNNGNTVQTKPSEQCTHFKYTKETIIANRGDGNAQLVALPQGHIPIENAISFPVLIAESLVGRITVANSPRGFTDVDVSAIRRLADYFALAIQHKRIEKQLKLTHETINRFSDAVYWINPDASFVYVNDAAVNKLGHPFEELIRMHVYEIDPQMPRERWASHWEQVKSSGAVTLDSVHCRKDGTTFPVEIRANFIRFGNREMIFAFAIDITERKLIETRLRASEQRFRDIAFASADYIWEIGSDGRFTYCSERVEDVLGYTPGEMIGRSPVDFMPPDETERMRRYFSEYTAGSHDKLEITTVNLTKKGKKRRIVTTGTPLYDEAGCLTGVRGVARDITDLRREEEARKKYQDELEIKNRIATVFLTNDGESMFPTTLAVVVKALNSDSGIFGCIEEDQTLDIKAVSESPAGKCDLCEQRRRIGPDKWCALWHSALAEKRTVRFDVGGSDSAMAAKCNSNALSCPVIHNGQAIAILSIARDSKAFTDEEAELLESLVKMIGPVLAARLQRDRIENQRKISSDALAKSEKLLSDAQRIAHIGSYEYDITTKRLYWSEELLNIFGIEHSAFTGRFEDLLARIHPDDAPGIAHIYDQSSDLQGITECEHRLLLPPGEERMVRIRAEILRDECGSPTRRVVIVQDITELFTARRETEKLRRIESVGLLAGGLAHDFNNYLGVILGNISLAADILATEPDEAIEIINTAKSSVKDATLLTKQLLTFSKGGAPILKPGSLNDLLRETCGFVLRGSSSRADFRLGRKIWNAQMDSGQISQVIQNIVINADQSMPGGGIITVTSSNDEVPYNSSMPPVPAGRYVRVSIADKGQGMTPGHLARVFDPYFTTKQKGHGLGLAMCFSIISRHNGYITADSIPDEGSTFTFWLPATDAAPEEYSAPAPAGVSLAGLRALIMDDNDLMRNLLQIILKRQGVDVTVSSDGLEAVYLYSEAMKTSPFDIVILDLTVPGGMGGEQAMQLLLEADPGVRAIVASGFSESPVLANYQEYGFRGMAMKPYEPSDIVAAVRNVLSKAER